MRLSMAGIFGVLFYELATAAQRDNSDWWSYIRNPDSDQNAVIQRREPSTSNFQILSVNLNSEKLFDEVAAKLGKPKMIERGDGSSGRSQACYRSAKDSENVHLIFETGEVVESFYLFVDGPDWNGSDACVRSSLITKDLSVASGIKLGQTPSQLRAILGEPSIVAKNTYTWCFGIEKRTPPKDLERARKQHAELSDEDFHRDYDFFYLGAHIDARFSDAKLVYLAVSKSETY